MVKQTGENKSNIVIADNVSIVRQALIDRLSRSYNIVGATANLSDTLAIAKKHKPDYIITGLGYQDNDFAIPVVGRSATLEDLGGIGSTRKLVETVPETRVLIYGSKDGRQVIFDALNAGARGYALKSDPIEDVSSALDAMGRGELGLSTRVMKAATLIAVNCVNNKGEYRTDELSQREIEVLTCAANGLSNQETADALGISLRTAETHKERIHTKLNLHDTVGLTKYALRKGFVGLDYTPKNGIQ